MTCRLLHYIFYVFNTFLFPKSWLSSTVLRWLSSSEFCANLDLSRRASSKFCACYLGLTDHDLPVSPLRIFWFCVVPVVWSVYVNGCFYGFNIWSAPDFIFLILWLFSIFISLFLLLSPELICSQVRVLTSFVFLRFPVIENVHIGLTGPPC
jgi:hypothetical protein